jgi:hypothetical protein
MRSCLAVATLLAVAFTVNSAAAQQAPTPPPGPARSSSQFTLRREEAGGQHVQAARARAQAGDCAGALAAFDAAIEVSIDPTLRRDRGLCHEKLGHPAPAMDDYRAYLTARPDAADAEGIRQRLAALEGHSTTGAGNRAENPELASGEASLRVGGRGKAEANASAKSNAFGAKPGEEERGYDYYVEQERNADAAASSPLRAARGFVLGAFLHMPRVWVGDGADNDLAYGVGATVRYATGSLLSIVGEAGWSGIGTAGESTAKSGPLLMGGVELRFPVTRWATDHLLLRGGLGYERHVVSGTRAATNNLLGRFAFGYRHVFGTSIALELLADGGPAYAIPETGDNRINAVLGASAAFLVGF